jgi:hypothetical protein
VEQDGAGDENATAQERSSCEMAENGLLHRGRLTGGRRAAPGRTN